MYIRPVWHPDVILPGQASRFSLAHFYPNYSNLSDNVSKHDPRQKQHFIV